MPRAVMLVLLATATFAQDPERVVAHRLNRAEYNNTILCGHENGQHQPVRGQISPHSPAARTADQ